MELLGYCLGEELNLYSLDKELAALKIGMLYRTRDFIRLLPKEHPGAVIFCFKNGTYVSWDLKRYQTPAFEALFLKHTTNPHNHIASDMFSYRYGEEIAIAPHDFFDVDCLVLTDDNLELKLSFAYGLSQSVKLAAFEFRLDALIEHYAPYIQALSKEGKMPLSRQQLQQIVGELMGAKHEMNLKSDFMSQPKYFWQRPTLEPHYELMERYMDFERRITALNHRLDILGEIFNMFQSYQENRHSHNLEVIIIVLIGLEIIFGLMNFHF